MTTALYTHPDFGAHAVPPGHVEQEGRYGAVEAALSGPDFAGLDRREAPRAELDVLADVHTGPHLSRMAEAGELAATGLVQLDPDTFMGARSLDAALRGVGGSVAAVDAVMAGEVDNAFVAARPPGHHTTPDRAMGFCLFNNAAAAALHALSKGLSRVAVVDFDVHHGNGTQDILETCERAFFASSHEWPQYPGTGRAKDRGPLDNCRNAPLATGEGSLAFRRAWGDSLLPALQDFAPDLIVISAGFDAHRDDPVGGLTLDDEDFAHVTTMIAEIAAETARGRIVSVLEGGYDLDALGRAAANHVKALASAPSPC